MAPRSIDFRNIPVQADIISGILRLDSESTSCFRDLDSFVRSDQGVATLVLRVVNSPLYSRGRQIATISLAISVLGFNVVRSLSMLAFSRAMFSNVRDPDFKLHVWQHSLLTAIAARHICQSLGDARDKDEAFIAGLMHDMGAVLMFNHDAAGYRQVMTQSIGQGADYLEVERQRFGFDRFQVGREAVGEWKLPDRFNDFLGADPRSPALSAADPVLHSLAVAHCLIESAGYGVPAAADEAARRALLGRFDLEPALVESWLQADFVASLKSDDTYQLCANL